MTARIAAAACFAVVVVAACPGGPGGPDAGTGAATLSAIHDEIFHPRCGASVCHGGAGPVRGLDLDGDPFGTAVNVASFEDPTILRIKSGDPDNSLLVQVLEHPVGNTRQMPIGGTIPPEDLARIKQWITDGAADN